MISFFNISLVASRRGLCNAIFPAEIGRLFHSDLIFRSKRHWNRRAGVSPNFRKASVTPFCPVRAPFFKVPPATLVVLFPIQLLWLKSDHSFGPRKFPALFIFIAESIILKSAGNIFFTPAPSEPPTSPL